MAEKKAAPTGTAKKAAPKGTFGKLPTHSESKWRKPTKKTTRKK